MAGPLAVAAITAGIPAIANLFGAKKGSNAAKDAANIQNDFGQKALDEQKRVYDIEKEEEKRQREARAGIFDRYGTDPSAAGSLPNPYGMDDAQAATMRQGNMGNRGNPGTMRPLPQPQTGDMRTQPVPMGGMGRPTMKLQAPTGEIMDVDLDEVPRLLRKGAVMVPGQGAQNAFGGSYGMV